MKHTLFIALLGATVTLATPSLSFADSGYKFKSGALDQNYNEKHSQNKSQRQVHKQTQKNQKSRTNTVRNQHKNNKKRFVAKPPKPRHIVKQINRDLNKQRHNRQDKRQIVKNNHGNNQKHNYNNHNQHNNKSSLSISWNAGNSNVTYGNNWNKGYNTSYNNGHRQNQGKKIYQRIHRQANRIQRGANAGQLVKREVRNLRHEQRNIKQTMSHYKRDGHLNRYESSKLHQLLDVASNNIERKSNNRLTRYSIKNHSHNDLYVQF